MAIPTVAIVGRPNVGKSSLFNWLAGRRIAIVDPTAGVTRDRQMTLVQAEERYIELMDTGGMGIQDVDNLTAEVERQIELAILKADVVLFVVDARDGVVPLDQLVSERLRSIGKPVLLVANKCDALELESHATDFFQLGYGSPLPVSALHNRGKDRLFSQVRRRLPAEGDETAGLKEVALKLAIVGRRNTGKSTFINQLAESERVIVSEVPGTTRDSVDVRFERDGLTILAIDTAGVRRKRSVKGDIDFYSMARAERSIRRADVVLHFLDSPKKIGMVDKKLVEYVLENSKPVIFVANKWDLLKQDLATGEFGDYVRKVFPMLDYVPIAFITAKTGKNVQTLVNLAQNLHKQASARVGTAEVNRVLVKAMEDQAPPLRQNRRAKVFYGTQVATNPPTIVLFTNGPELFSNTYQRYLLKTFRDHLPFGEVPIKMYLRNKTSSQEGTEGEEDAPKKKAARPKAGKPRKPKKPASAKAQSELWED